MTIFVTIAVVGVVAVDGDRLEHAARVGREALDAERDEVGEARRRAAALLAREAEELIDVERRDAAAADRRARLARPCEELARRAPGGRPMRTRADAVLAGQPGSWPGG